MTTVLRYLTRAALVLAIALLPASPAATGQAPSTAQATTAAPDGKKVLTLADYGSWKRITSDRHQRRRQVGDLHVFAQRRRRDAVRQATRRRQALHDADRLGGRRGPRRRPRRWRRRRRACSFPTTDGGLATTSIRRRRRPGARVARGGGRGAGARGGAPAPGAAPGAAGSAGPVRQFELLDLTSGAKYNVPNAAGFQFSKGSQWLAIKMNGVPTDTTHRGADLLVRRLATGATQNIGNVTQYDFDDSGRMLAYTVDATGRMGNGVYVANLATEREPRARQRRHGLRRPGLARRSSTSLAVLRGDKPKGKGPARERRCSPGRTPAPRSREDVEWDPSKDAAFPKGFVLSEFTAPRWSKDGARMFVGIKAQEDTPVETARQTANLDIFHWKDVELQSEQMIRIGAGAARDVRGDVTVASKTVRAARRRHDSERHADRRRSLGDRPRRHAVRARISPKASRHAPTTTGSTRRPARARSSPSSSLRTMGTSPDSQWFLYLDNQHVMASNLVTGKIVPRRPGDRQELHQHRQRSRGRKADLGRGGLVEGRQVGAALRQVRRVVAAARRRQGHAICTSGIGAAQQVQLRLTRLGAAGGGRGGRGGGGGGAPR